MSLLAFAKARSERLVAWLEKRPSYRVLRDTAKDWVEDDAPGHAAAIAYYALFSLAPLLLVALAIAGFFFDEAAARQQLLGTAEELLGAEGADGVRALLENTRDRMGGGLIAGAIGLGVLLFGASTVFAHLKRALNDVWEVQERRDVGFLHKVKDRVLSVGMVLGFGFLLLVSLVMGALLSAGFGMVKALVPGPELAWGIAQVAIAVLVSTAIFAALFKFLPNVEISWRQVGMGAFATAVLFEVGRVLIGLYLGRSAFGSSFGAAGSVVVLLAWLYYSGLIFFFGAEMTQVLARRHGEPVEPDEYAFSTGHEKRSRSPRSPGSARRG